MSINALPEEITHNFHPEGPFLANLCDLPPAEAEEILQRHRDLGRRTIKANYLRRRMDTETWLIGERQRLLGNTRRNRPIYFFLGDFADGKDPSRPCSLVMPLGVFSPSVLTFTFPDSMASLPIATLESHRLERRPYHGKVFTLGEIRRVVAEFGLPGEHWRSDYLRRFDRFIEVQVWDDRPILEFLVEQGQPRCLQEDNESETSQVS
ncbi:MULTISPECIES: hypothetical protein [unclassified Mesorhizobium]|uniref:hypothetical protein n=1 Tax=unclassified Mesorhizobium TaxID=325217 RepID=UPI0033385728